MERVPSYVENLDGILGGGFPAASIHIIAGEPGTGKTMLMQQFVYGNATPERKAVFLTTVSEPMHKVIRYGQHYSFFDPEKVGAAVQYDDIGEVLRKGNIEEAMAHIERIVTRDAPAFLVIDSFKGLRDLVPDISTFRRALYRLTGVLTASGCTVFLVGEYAEDDIAHLPEFAIADGIVLLKNERHGTRTYRYLSVAKLRGSDYEEGQHAIRLTDDGVVVFPRFRTPDVANRYKSSGERLSLGVPGVDGLLDGGPLRGTTTLLAGPTGSGKTVLTLNFVMSSVFAGKKAVFVSLQEDPNQIVEVARDFGWEIPEAEQEDRLHVLYEPPVEFDIDEHVLRIIDTIHEVGADVVAIDSVTDLEAEAPDALRFRNFAYSLVQYMKDAGITALLTFETNEGADGNKVTGRGVSRIADNVITLGHARDGRRVRRELRIMKTRGSDHDHDVHFFRLGKDGFRLTEPGDVDT